MNLSALHPYRWIIILALLTIGSWITLPYLIPSRGLERSWSHLIEAIEEHDTETLAALIAADYRDGFGQDRDQAITLFDQAARQFIALGIRRERPSVHVESARFGRTEAVIRIAGNGTPLALMIVRGSSGIDTPTVFRWRRPDWRPWRWELVSVENPAVRVNVIRLHDQLRRLDAGTGGALSDTR